MTVQLCGPKVSESSSLNDTHSAYMFLSESELYVIHFVGTGPLMLVLNQSTYHELGLTGETSKFSSCKKNKYGKISNHKDVLSPLDGYVPPCLLVTILFGSLS